MGMAPSGTMPAGAMPVNNNMMPQAAQQMSYAQTGGTAYAPQGLASGDGFTNVPENTPPQQLPFP